MSISAKLRGTAIVALVLQLSTSAGYAGETGQVRASIADLNFLSGCWRTDGNKIEEYWSKSLGKSMTGYCRFVKEGKTTFYELLTITEEDRKPVLRMRHFNAKLEGWSDDRECGDCHLIELGDGLAVFANNNPAHQVKISYRRVRNRLRVEVEIKKEGSPRVDAFDYVLVK
ncbi:MAG: hypothetical protein KC777_02500 [Cyanobacteria bacterium HKST-UBA02]|nr:hypothetical protein [Cyanobacteria bacterium HKST-UBA02]